MKKRPSYKFKINLSDAKNFAKASGDYNKIHLDKKYGSNSIFGEIICHGCFVFIKILEKIKNKKIINNKIFTISLNFKKFFSYNKLIKVYLKNNNSIDALQDSEKKLSIKISTNSANCEFDHKKYRKKYFMNKISKNYILTIKRLLMIISRYVGMFYPGKNSLIQNITISVNKNENSRSSKILLLSKKISKQYPFVENYIDYGQIKIFFTSIIRPKFKFNETFPSKFLLKKIKSVNKNILIIGASNGIGSELLNLFCNNRKIKIISTYNKNLITKKQKNLKKIKINVLEDMTKINDIIKKYQIKKIFYMATPKISLEKISYKKMSEYKNYYLDIPIKIIKMIDKNVYFFYPSTQFIKKNNFYSQIKKSFEAKVKKYKYKKNVQIQRIPEINTKQNLSFLDRNLPTYISFLNDNKSEIKKILYK